MLNQAIINFFQFGIEIAFNKREDFQVNMSCRKPDGVVMAKILHILKCKPDENVVSLIEATAVEDEIAVVSLYQDEVSGTAVNWSRLVEDIFVYDRVICWW